MATLRQRKPMLRSRALSRVVQALSRVAIGVVAVIVAGNLAILLLFGLARAFEPEHQLALADVDHLRAVDEQLWRGEAPSRQGVVALANAGVGTLVDLRAERDIVVDEALLAELGLQRVHLPIRDGQTPKWRQVQRFLAVVEDAPERVFVHCGAGVGRTGTMVGAYLVRGKGAGVWDALRRNLAVGPPSLEQIAYVLDLNGDNHPDVPDALVYLSRLWDAPRRIYTAYLTVT